MYVPTTKPFTSAIYQQTIMTLLEAFPFIGVRIICKSRLDCPIYSLTIGRGGSSAKKVLINAAHHANEWITSVLALKFLEEYAEKTLGKNPDVTLFFVPMVNPDGVDLVTGGIDELSPSYYIARRLSEEPFDNWKANIVGVDLNSNYPAGWELAKQHKFESGYTKPGPRDFVGPHPLSEPETRAMAAYTMQHDFAFTISLHTQGEEIYWQYENHNPPGATELAERLAKASGYKLEDVPSESSHAGYRDWFIEKFNRPGLTIECGLGENPLPIADFEDMYKKVAPMLWEATKLYFPS